MSACRLVISSANWVRLHAAAEWLGTRLGRSEILLVAPTHGAADDLVRAVAQQNGPVFGVRRFTPLQLAARLAAFRLASAGLAPLSRLGMEALAARAIHIGCQAGELSYFTPVVKTPGFARALASTLTELRLERVAGDQLASAGPSGQDLARLLARYEESLAARSLADLAAIFAAAAEFAPQSSHPLLGLPTLLLDTTWPSTLERACARELVARSPEVLATAHREDQEGIAQLEEVLGTAAEPIEGDPGSSLEGLRRQIFSPAAPTSRLQSDGSVELFSAPGEGPECVEIARRIHLAATPEGEERGLPFDRVAIVLRNPDVYYPLVEEALARAEIPAYFTAGTLRPDPAGRAFLALLDCALEGLSASRFAEYLSLGQVPAVDESGGPPEPKGLWVGSEDDGQLSFRFPAPAEERTESEDSGRDDSPVAAGTLRTPFAWEKLLIDAAVIGGRERWHRRLAGLRAEFELQIKELERLADPSVVQTRRQLECLGHLERFALPVIERLDVLPKAAPWGEWLATLRGLAEMTLRHPESVLSMLAELEPMDAVGPVALDEVRLVLAERLTFLRREPPARRYGRVWVGTPEEVQGRSFDLVFIPGLAEGLFPQRAFEDPLLLDQARSALSPKLLTRTSRVQREQMLLRSALAAARRHVCVSYPRIDTSQGRSRVPSIYALEVVRGHEGRLPDLRELEERVATASGLRLGWPAPNRPQQAVDDAEYDLAVLDVLLHRPAGQAAGQAAHLLEANPCVARSLRSRYRRWHQRSWGEADGIYHPDRATLEALAAHRLSARPHSPSALQHFAACPYRFLLYGIHHLRPREKAEAIEQMDPLTRGALFHEVQFSFFRRLQAEGLLPVRRECLPAALDAVDRALEEAAARYAEKLAPAIPPIWHSEIEDLRMDLRGWVQMLAQAEPEWLPVHFEYSFGLAAEPRAGAEARPDRDPHSSAAAAVILDGVRLRGSIDLLEKHQTSGDWRVTDHKTGLPPSPRPTYTGRGEVLQPLLYALAVESLRGQQVVSSVLFYCTQRGNYQRIEIKPNAEGRKWISKVTSAIDAAIREGRFPAAPRRDACSFCDYRPVCGPWEELRASGYKERLEPLNELRSLP